MAKTPRMEQIEAMLADDPNDAFLRYGLAMEHAGQGDDATAAAILKELIALDGLNPYIPAFLMGGQALARLGREADAAALLREGIAAAKRANTPSSLHAMGEMEGLLATVE